jgi:hypothetical protein
MEAPIEELIALAAGNIRCGSSVAPALLKVKRILIIY